MQMVPFYVYNGTKHDVDYYGYEGGQKSRDFKWYRREGVSVPLITFRSEMPLTIKENHITELCNGVHFSRQVIYQAPWGNVPNVFYPPYGQMPNFQGLDIIVVSRVFANAALKNMTAGNIDFLDRLFMIEPLWDNDRIVGAVSFRKVSQTRSVPDYIQLIRNGYLPSRAAVQSALFGMRSEQQFVDLFTMQSIPMLDTYVQWGNNQAQVG